jgi:hypothetical protein
MEADFNATNKIIVPATAVESMLGAIENMKFFLRTGFGDSTSFAGGGISIKMQGMCQGNGASPAGWAVISICWKNESARPSPLVQ